MKEIERAEQQRKILADRLANEVDVWKATVIRRMLETPPEEIIDFSQFVSPKKAAYLIGVSIPTLYKYLKEGYLTQYGIGRKRYFRRDELAEFINYKLITKNEGVEK